MHNNGRKRMTVVFGCGLVFVTVSGCAIKHSDVMVFGTNTKYGLSIAADQPENTPHLNVGYKRQEFVWMPLVANGADSEIQTRVGTITAGDLKYIGKEPTGKEDTYSVLASFGANFKASGAAGGGGGIAQYFATGIAARILAEVGGASLVQASSVDLTPKETELTHEQKESLKRVLEPTPERKILIGKFDLLMNKQLKPDFSYNEKKYEQDQTKQYADDYVAKEIDSQSHAYQIRIMGTDDKLEKLVTALGNAVQQ